MQIWIILCYPQFLIEITYVRRQQGACLPEAAAGQAASLLPARQGPAAVLAPAMAAAADCARERSASKSMQK